MIKFFMSFYKNIKNHKFDRYPFYDSLHTMIMVLIIFFDSKERWYGTDSTGSHVDMGFGFVVSSCVNLVYNIVLGMSLCVIHGW